MKKASTTIKKNAPKAIAKSAAPTKNVAAVKSGIIKKAIYKQRYTPPVNHHDDLQQIFEDCLKDIYWAEKHLTKALPKMAKAADNEKLKEVFLNHLEETKSQVERVEEVFGAIGVKAQTKLCPAMKGLVEEGQESVEDYGKGPARDASLIVAAQKIEHYEISGYGSLTAFAEALGHEDAAMILRGIGEEEKNADSLLGEIAIIINKMAVEGPEVKEDDLEIDDGDEEEEGEDGDDDE